MNNFLSRLKKEYRYVRKPDWTLKEVGEHWDETTDYDDINERTYSYFRRFIDAFEIFPNSQKSYALDICCRTGNGTFYFWQKERIKKAVCADVSQKMLDLCAARLKDAAVDWQPSLFLNFPLPYPDKEFETVLCFETLEHISQPAVFLKELGRVAKSGATLVLTTPNVLWEPVHWLAAIIGLHHSEGPHRFRRRKNILKWLNDSGFKILNEKTTVLVAFGPKFLTGFFEKLEKFIPEFIRRIFCLRRIFICKRI